MSGTRLPKAVFNKDTALEELDNAVVDEKVKDRRVIKILRKYLDLGLSENQRQAFESADFEALGELLHDLIFNPADENLHKSFDAWYTTAVNDGDGDEPYNIFLEFEREKAFDDLAMLPWEYIYYKRKDKMLSNDDPFLGANRSRRINLYRKIPFNVLSNHDQEASLIFMPLKILFIISEGLKEGENLNLEQKYPVLNYFLKLQEEMGDKVEIRYLIQPKSSQDGLTDELNNGSAENRRFTDWKNWRDTDLNAWDKLNALRHNSSFNPDVIHFLGHGQIVSNSGVLKMSQPNDFAEDTFTSIDVKDEDFARCIRNSRLNPKLVLLHACNGGRIVDYLDGGGIAVQLLKMGVPYVIAMQNTILESEALAFTKVFYTEFLDGKDIGSCVTAGRFKLSGDGRYKQKAFGSPVLFTSLEQPLQLVLDKAHAAGVEDDATISVMKYCENSKCRNRGVRFPFAATTVSCPFCGSTLKSEIHEEIISEPISRHAVSPRPASQNSGMTREEKYEGKEGLPANVRSVKPSKSSDIQENWKLKT